MARCEDGDCLVTASVGAAPGNRRLCGFGQARRCRATGHKNRRRVEALRTHPCLGRAGNSRTDIGGPRRAAERVAKGLGMGWCCSKRQAKQYHLSTLRSRRPLITAKAGWNLAPIRNGGPRTYRQRSFAIVPKSYFSFAITSQNGSHAGIAQVKTKKAKDSSLTGLRTASCLTMA
jgi:hypothetical protein